MQFEYAPIEFTPEHITHKKYWLSTPQTIIVEPLDIDQLSLTEGHHTIESYDLNKDLNLLSQQNMTVLEIGKLGKITALGCYMAIDFGLALAGHRFMNTSRIPALGPKHDKRGPSLNSKQGDPNYSRH